MLYTVYVLYIYGISPVNNDWVLLIQYLEGWPTGNE